jgi:hypothetical protein
MPKYTPPQSDAADFALGTYTAPNSDAADFELISEALLSPAPTSVRLAGPTASVSGETVSVGATAGTVQVAGQAASVQAGTVSLSPATTPVTVAGQPAALATRGRLQPAPTGVQFDGQPAGIGFEEWAIDGGRAGTNRNEVATDQTLTLSQRVTTTTLESTLRALKADEGKVDVITVDDGGFRAVDRADGANTFEIIPPVYRQPLRQTETYHVERYEEDLVSQEVGEWDVQLDLIREQDRTDTRTVSETPTTDEWGFTTTNGTIATARVDAEFAGTGRDGVERWDLTARLTFNQALAFETALSRIGGGRVKSIPDAANVAVDDTSGDVATVTVDTPDGNSIVADGAYLVTEWESTRLNDAFQEVAFTLAEK